MQPLVQISTTFFERRRFETSWSMNEPRPRFSTSRNTLSPSARSTSLTSCAKVSPVAADGSGGTSGYFTNLTGGPVRAQRCSQLWEGHLRKVGPSKPAVRDEDIVHLGLARRTVVVH